MFFDKFKRKPLSEFTAQELMNMLETNSKMDLKDLAGICSEVLRRLVKNEKIKKWDLRIDQKE